MSIAPITVQGTTYAVEITSGEDGYLVVTCPSIGAVTEGATREVALANAYEVIRANVPVSRPRTSDIEVCRRTAAACWARIKGWCTGAGEDADEVESEKGLILDHVADSIRYEDDAYQATSRLETKGWGGNAAMVDVMDDILTVRYGVLVVMEAEWAVKHAPKPLFKVGDAVVVVGLIGRPSAGEVKEVDLRRARYLVYSAELGHVREGSGSHGTWFPFESVAPASKEAL